MLHSFILVLTATRAMCSSWGDGLYTLIFPCLFNWHVKISPSSNHNITLHDANKSDYHSHYD